MESIQRAFEIIKSRLGNGGWQQGERMPSLAEMAKICTVSRSTMWMALKILKKESLVHATPRGAIFAGPTGIPRLDEIQSNVLWKRIKNRIGRDLLTGAFTGPELPPASKLALRYGVSVLTLKKSLKDLAGESMLTPHGHRYLLPRGPRTHQSTIVLISSSTNFGDIIDIKLPDPRTCQVFESFERESIRMGFGYKIVGFNEYSPGCLLDISRALESIADTAGFVVSLWDPDEKVRKCWGDLFHYLASRKVPVVILDQSGRLVLQEPASSHRNIRILRIPGIRSGEMVADALNRNGHRRIAYISATYQLEWAQNRYAGLCRFYKQYGGPKAAVELFALNEISDLTDLVLKILELDRNQIAVLFKTQSPNQDLDYLARIFDRIKTRRLLDAGANDPKIKTIRAEARHLYRLAKEEPDPEIFGRFFDAFYDRASSYAVGVYLRPLFEKVLKNSAATAWVCADDKSALAAMSFLASKGVRVPEEISVVGFDNWAGNFYCGLSSYDFNMNSMILQALAMIADPKSLKRIPPTMVVDGYLVERKSIKNLQ